MAMLPRAAVAVAALSVLGGCGTNLVHLLAEDGRLTAEADELLTIAESTGNGLEEPVYAAEDRKLEACKFLNDAAMDQFERDYGFGEQFVSDLSQVIVLIFPVGQVEACAGAFRSYEQAVAELERQLVAQGALPGGVSAEMDPD